MLAVPETVSCSLWMVVCQKMYMYQQQDLMGDVYLAVNESNKSTTPVYNVRPLNFSVDLAGFVPALNLLHSFRSSKG